MVSVAADVNTKYIEKKTVKLAGTLIKGEQDKKKMAVIYAVFPVEKINKRPN